MHLLSVGSPYPYQLPKHDGALADLLRPSGNHVLIAISHLSSEEIQVLRRGVVYGGILSKDGALLLVWVFKDAHGKTLITLDSPFNARVIPDIQLHHVDQPSLRLMLDIQIVDRASGVIQGLRALSMPPEMTLAFMSAVQDQLASPYSGEQAMQGWMALDPNELALSTHLWVMGT